MGRESRIKGANGEREFAAFCRDHGFKDARRGGQAKYQRGSELPDCLGLPFIHVECKRVERLNLAKAMEQSARDAEDEGRGNLPIVAHRQNRRPWYITMLAKDWFRIYAAALKRSERK